MKQPDLSSGLPRMTLLSQRNSIRHPNISTPSLLTFLRPHLHGHSLALVPRDRLRRLLLQLADIILHITYLLSIGLDLFSPRQYISALPSNHAFWVFLIPRINGDETYRSLTVTRQLLLPVALPFCLLLQLIVLVVVYFGFAVVVVICFQP